ncbi:BTAD domain-containing putative transcriptional regulator [Cryptosporangium minutisporangium]|uniref:BTAD domain-containing putative transcriptional regulator n=1 Tax=Cryptosporangium minutisporangium TaxID=113569 RepID=UPI0035EF0F40
MQFGVLGPLAVTTDGGAPVAVPGAKVRLLLADLLTNRNHVVSADRLIDDLWGADAPANPAGALQVRVSQLRKALGDAEPGGKDLVESRAPGYVLRTTVVDADRFAALAAGSDVESLSAALALWRGDAYADLADSECVRAEATRLTEQRLVAQEKLAAARLARGEHDLVAADLAELVARHPLREGLRALHIRALYAAGRQAEALDSYADLRERLAEELGLDPSPELVALHGKLLAQDSELSPAPAPPPPAAARIRNSLPARLDELVGRGEALAELRHLVPARRLVTLVGPGGVGKTRLATEVARGQSYPDGVHLVELAPLPPGDPGVVDRVLTALDVHEPPGSPVTAADRLTTALRSRDLLLVLDNCEHVLDAAADLVGHLLRDAPGVRVLATSREPLGLTGEVLWEVPPLPLPDDEYDVDAVRRSAAARLFTARAAAQQRTFRLDERTAPAVAQLCRRLDGLPLALELAATRVRALGLAGVVERLDDRFSLLTATTRDLPSRQRALTAVIGWSWDLLPDAHRQVLARLAVFSDGCTAEAAAEVCAADLDTLTTLVDRSLVVFDEDDRPRYRLLESIAAFGLERLEHPDDVRARHAAYFTALAERADPELRGPRQGEWLARLDAETANFAAALEHGGGLRLANALTWYWFLRGRLTEARRALAVDGDAVQEARAVPWRLGFAVLQGAPVSPDELRKVVAGCADDRSAWFVGAAALERSELALADELLPAEPADRWTDAAAASTRAMIAHATGDLAALERWATRSARLFTELEDRWGQLRASDWLGGLAEMRGDHAAAAAVHQEGLRSAEALALWPEAAGKLSWLAWLAVQTRDNARGVELAERAYRLAREQGTDSVLVFAQLSLGIAARRSGALDVAVEHLTRLAERGRAEAQPALYLPMILVELGYAAEQRGDPDAGMALHREAFGVVQAFAVAQGMELPRDAAAVVEAMASAAAALGSPEVAALLLGAAAASRSPLEAPAAPAERDEIARVAERLTETLGPDRFATLTADGRTLSLEQAVQPL